MDSPPSCSAWSASDIVLSSDDSGLLLTSGSFSSSSETGSGFCHIAMELQESDDDRSASDGGCLFSTLKRGPWCDETFDTVKRVWNDVDSNTISPPPEFQDSPQPPDITHFEKYAARLVSEIVKEALLISCKVTWSIPCSQECHMSEIPVKESVSGWTGVRLCWTPDMHPYSPCHGVRPGSRVSLTSSRLSSSHNSLSVPAANRADDSSFITSAMSHDTLASSHLSDTYNVPFDSDIYAVPVDVVRNDPKPPTRVKRLTRRRHLDSEHYTVPVSSQSQSLKPKTNHKRHSTPSAKRSASTECSSSEPIHMTLQEVRQYLHTLYSNSNESESKKKSKTFGSLKNELKRHDCYAVTNKNKKNIKRKTKDFPPTHGHEEKCKKLNNFSSNIKRTLCNIFQFKKLPSPDQCMGKRDTVVHSDEVGVRLSCHIDRNPPSPITKPPFSKRALPPLPSTQAEDTVPLLSCNSTDETLQVIVPGQEEPTLDFASSIQKVKDYGWYWGPISGEAAEKILSTEPDGSFIVRDSSDDYYIFSLTFKLNSIVRHVRIEHDQGNFSFGSSTRFKSHTIVEFIESAVEHSRSGRYLFFLHRRPVLGPMRVQLLHPVSRFKHVQSLQHMCRFVILKLVRRDLIHSLPLPRRLLDYLSTPHYYTENLVIDEERPDSPVKTDSAS